MATPGFGAAYSLYLTQGQYVGAGTPAGLSGGTATLHPQACTWWNWIGCRTSIVTCRALCAIGYLGTVGKECEELCLLLSGVPEFCSECL